ncbi:MAG TPA: hypothetical protein VGK92_03905, partial [Gaiellales bacterium]
MRKRFSIAAGVATTLALLVLPSLASANPGTGPELVQRSGRLVVLHADRDDGTSSEQWQLVKGASHVDVHAPDDVWITPGTPVRLEGAMVGHTLELADSETAVTETGVAPMLAAADATAAAPAIRRTAVVIVTFGGGPPATTNAAAGNVVNNDVNAYYQEQTYGQLGFSDDVVYGPFAEPATTDCTGTTNASGPNGWANDALRQVPSGYQDYVLVFPSTPSCNFSGQAEIGGDTVWINGPPTLRVLAHELGHNLGLGHAGGLACSGAPVSASCSPPSVYGDPFDPMGGYSGPVRQMNMEHKLAL